MSVNDDKSDQERISSYPIQSSPQLGKVINEINEKERLMSSWGKG